MQSSKYLKNSEITAGTVFLIGEDGKPVGKTRTPEALRRAKEAGLDLVLVSAGKDLPVCRIADFGKMSYEAMKKEKDGRKKQKATETKELRITPSTAEHDLQTKAKAAVKFLENGNRVKATCRFRGREAAMPEEGENALLRIAQLIGDAGAQDGGIRREGRSLSVMFVPKATGKKGIERGRKKAETTETN